MLILALGLQTLLFVHLAFVLHQGISLRGEGLEILVLIATIMISVQGLFQVSFARSPRRTQVFYVLDCIGLVPLWITATVMGFCIYAVQGVGTFNAPSGARVTLKSHAGLLGCSIRPYRLHGLIERRIYREDNYIHCAFPERDFSAGAAQWSDDESQLILTVDQEVYVFDLTPQPDQG